MVELRARKVALRPRVYTRDELRRVGLTVVSECPEEMRMYAVEVDVDNGESIERCFVWKQYHVDTEAALNPVYAALQAAMEQGMRQRRWMYELY